MSETKDKILPGIDAYIEPGEKGFSKIKMLLDATGGLSLSQVCAVTGLEGSTIQNWVKRGWVAHPKGKKYEEVHIARILIINALKECIKLEHIALLMDFVSGGNASSNEPIIGESELFNFLCEALGKMSGASGVEAVVEDVILDYSGPTPDAKLRIRKALTLMMYACVCTDVKRRTESMMKQILHELENPEQLKAQVTSDEPKRVVESKEKEEEETDAQEQLPEARKTIAQTLREWDVSSVERIIIDHEAEPGKAKDNQGKPVNRPWFSRKNVK